MNFVGKEGGPRTNLNWSEQKKFNSIKGIIIEGDKFRLAHGGSIKKLDLSTQIETSWWGVRDFLQVRESIMHIRSQGQLQQLFSATAFLLLNF